MRRKSKFSEEKRKTRRKMRNDYRDAGHFIQNYIHREIAIEEREKVKEAISLYWEALRNFIEENDYKDIYVTKIGVMTVYLGNIKRSFVNLYKKWRKGKISSDKLLDEYNKAIDLCLYKAGKRKRYKKALESLLDSREKLLQEIKDKNNEEVYR